MTEVTSLPASHFEALYARDPDPWRFATSAYEREKYVATLSALPTHHIGAVLEVGCSIGVLTRQLALRCASLLAVDVAETALAHARRRCAGLPHVTIRRLSIPQEWPAGQFDVILFSEVLYYFSPADVAVTAWHARRALRPGGAILLVHYILPTNYPCTGDAASQIFIEALGLPATLRRREECYRLDLLRA
jgi:cyclopropane fatty-acyl-phospholipid synthase-like methyltransferase